jgi:hypothetical protein
MNKILLTSGSSFSVDSIKSEDDPTVNANFDKWPTVLSNMLDFNLINCSKPGASNLYMYDHLMEQILKHGDNIGLVVVAWSYGFKTSIFRNYDLNLINVQDQDFDSLTATAEFLRTKILDNDALLSSIEQTLRLMLYLQDTCNSKNIKCVHYPLLNIFKTGLETTEHLNFLKQLTKLDSYQTISTFNNLIGWPCDTYLGGHTYSTAYPELIISNKDKHPNEQGQKIIAQEIYDKYLQL